MIRVLLSLLLLEVCAGTVDHEHYNHWTPFERSSSSNNEQSRRVAREVADKKAFGEPGNYVTTVIYCDVPPLPDTISIGSASDKTDKFSILFNHVTFSKLSSAFALLFRIDLDSQIVQLILRLGKAHINGSYCLSTPSAPNTAYDNFELNLYVDLMYSYNIRFHIDDEKKITFGKVEDRRLHHNKVKGRYVNVPNVLAEDVNSYLSLVLLEAITDKIHKEVSAQVSLDDVSHQIKSEMQFKYRSIIADRLQKAVASASDDVHWNCFYTFHNDKTNFYRIIQNYDVTIPSFIQREVGKFVVHDLKFSYVGDNVHAKGLMKITSSLVILRVNYCNRNDPLAQNRTAKAEYLIADIYYDYDVMVKPETQTVDVVNIGVHVSDATLAPSQGLYGDERDLIIRHLTPYIKVFFPNNGYFIFSTYMQGLFAEDKLKVALPLPHPIIEPPETKVELVQEPKKLS